MPAVGFFPPFVSAKQYITSVKSILIKILSKTYENALKYIILELKWHRKWKHTYVKQENCIRASS